MAWVAVCDFTLQRVMTMSSTTAAGTMNHALEVPEATARVYRAGPANVEHQRWWRRLLARADARRDDQSGESAEQLGQGSGVRFGDAHRPGRRAQPSERGEHEQNLK